MPQRPINSLSVAFVGDGGNLELNGQHAIFFKKQGKWFVLRDSAILLRFPDKMPVLSVINRTVDHLRK